MAKKMLIDATHAEETRVVVVDGNKVEEFDFESENKRQLAGNIYLARVTRVEPSLQAAFIEYGGNRHGFLAFSEIHPDYYQIPVADREALLEEERAYAEAMKEDDEKPAPKKRRSRSRSRPKAEETKTDDAVETKEIDVSGMDVVDLDLEVPEGSSPMELVPETPVDTPANEDETAPDDVESATGDDDAEPGALPDAAAKDDQIESVADEDVTEEIRRPRKPRVRRYKIQEVIKVRQILLVQVVKEERGNKGAALTTYLSLAGRYCVLMPNTARGGGISRKITNAADRKKLKAIAGEIDVPQGAGLIVRTAGANRTKSEIKRDYEYLQRLWEQIRALTLKSIAPAKIYEEGDLIKRSIRDLYNREIDEVFVEGEAGYRVAKDFMKMIMPSHAKNVKQYTDPLPLFARFQVESYLAGMFNPTVQLKSGGYIVIGVTEALVAVDVNSGRATKEGSIEETATKTNLEAAEEVARQLRLRDLAGLIVIDFIDMEERKNNAAVEKRLKDKLKTDRARIQMGRISGFGLLEMSRQRLRPGMIEATTQPCPHCHGTGLIRSDDNLALMILRQLEEEGVRARAREVLLKAPIGIVNFLVNNKREHLAQIESRYGLSIRIEADPFLISPDFSIERFKTATRIVPEASAPVVSGGTSLMEEIDQAEEVVEAEEKKPEADEDAQGPKKRRRRRRRRRGGGNGGADAPEQADQQAAEGVEARADEGQGLVSDATDSDTSEPAAEGSKSADTPEVAVDEAAGEEVKKPRKRAPRSRVSRAKTSKAKDAPEGAAGMDGGADAPEEAAAAEPATEAAAEPAAEADAAAEKPKKPRRTRRAKKPAADAPGDETPAREPETTAGPAAETRTEEAEPSAPEESPEPVAEAEAVSEPAPEPVAEPAPALAETAEPDSDPSKPKKRGWWSMGR